RHEDRARRHAGRRRSPSASGRQLELGRHLGRRQGLTVRMRTKRETVAASLPPPSLRSPLGEVRNQVLPPGAGGGPWQVQGSPSQNTLLLLPSGESTTALMWYGPAWVEPVAAAMSHQRLACCVVPA